MAASITRSRFGVALCFILCYQVYGQHSDSCSFEDTCSGNRVLTSSSRNEGYGTMRNFTLIPLENQKPSNPLLVKEPAEYPAELIWSNISSPVKDQKICGSCWAFSTIEIIESAAMKAGLISNADFSAEQILSCTGHSYKCDGGWVTAGLDYLSSHGTVDESVWPYACGSCQPKYSNSCSCYCTGRCSDPVLKNYYQVYPSQYFEVETGTCSQMENYAVTYLNQYSPLGVHVDADHYNVSDHENVPKWSTYSGGVVPYTSNLICPRTVRLDHALVLVGYTPEYWVVRNSWGEAWGEQGYIYLARKGTPSVPVDPDQCTNCAKRTPCGCAGVLTQMIVIETVEKSNPQPNCQDSSGHTTTPEPSTTTTESSTTTPAPSSTTPKPSTTTTVPSTTTPEPSHDPQTTKPSGSTTPPEEFPGNPSGSLYLSAPVGWLLFLWLCSL